MMHTHVLKTTTDKLEKLLDEWLQGDYTHPGRTVTEYTVHHVGGRDWVVVIRHPNHPPQHGQITWTGGGQWTTNTATGSTTTFAQGGAVPASNQPVMMVGPTEAVEAVRTVKNSAVVGPVKVELYDPDKTYSVGPGGEKRKLEAAGLVEDEAQTWIMWFGADGRPTHMWLQRDETGGVIGQSIVPVERDAMMIEDKWLSLPMRNVGEYREVKRQDVLEIDGRAWTVLWANPAILEDQRVVCLKLDVRLLQDPSISRSIVRGEHETMVRICRLPDRAWQKLQEGFPVDPDEYGDSLRGT